MTQVSFYDRSGNESLWKGLFEQENRKIKPVSSKD